MEALQRVRFGDVAMRCGFISPEAVAGCLKIQGRLQRDGHSLRLGEIMVKKGYLRLSQVDSVLLMQQFTTVRNDSVRFLADWLKQYPGRRNDAEAALARQVRLYKDDRKIVHVSELLQSSSRWSFRSLTSKLSDRIARPGSGHISGRLNRTTID